MWFFISIAVVFWFIGVITFGLGAYWVHGLLAAAIVLGFWNLLSKKRKSIS